MIMLKAPCLLPEVFKSLIQNQMVSGAEHGGHEFQSSDFSVLLLTYLF